MWDWHLDAVLEWTSNQNKVSRKILRNRKKEEIETYKE